MPRVLSALLALSFLFLALPQAYAWQVGVAPATRKIMQDLPVPNEQSVQLMAARNEWEAFQIVVKDDAGVQGVDVSITDLSMQDGGSISSDNIRLYREYYVDITNDSPGSVTYHERELGLYPDPLIPFTDPYATEKKAVGAPFDLQGEQVGAIFVDCYVPTDTAPGEYTGTATVTATGKEPVEIPISLTVWELEQPKTKSVATAFNFSWDHIVRYHGGIEQTDEELVQTIINNYYIALHEHHIDPTHLKGPVSFEFDEDGELLPIDWTEYDAYMTPFMTGSLFPDGEPVKRFNVTYFKPGRGIGSMTEEQYSRAAAAFAEHLNEKGWWDKAYIYATDEPWLNGGDETFNQIKHDATLLFTYSDLWRDKILVTGPYDERIGDEVGIWCPVTPMYEDWWWIDGSRAGWDDYTPLLEQGKQLWFYVCNANTPPYAGYDIDTQIGYEPRIVKWGTWFERGSGFLYWRVNYWIDNDPWNKYMNLENFGEPFSRNGDGILIYPGDHNGNNGGMGSPEDIAIDGPILSYRLKQIRDGFEDWELFNLTSRLGGEDYVREQVRRAYTRFGNFFVESCESEDAYCPDDQPWTLDEYLLFEVRENIAKKALYLSYPDRYPDPEASSTDGDLDGESVEQETDNDTSATDGDQVVEDGDDGCSGTQSPSSSWSLLLLCAALCALMLRRKNRSYTGQ